MELPPSSKYLARRDETISDAERDSLSKRLAGEFEAGRLDQPTYMELLDKLYEARTMGDLVPVAKHVPDTVSDTPAIVATGTGKPGELSPISSKSIQPVVVAGAVLGVVAIILVALIILL